MGALLGILAVLSFGVAAVCSIIIMIDAFKNEVWKGLLYFFCGLYALYYALVEYDSEKKVLVLVGLFGGGILGYALLFGAGAMSGSHAVSP